MPSRKHIALYFLSVLLLCSWHLDDGLNDNCVSRAAMVQALAQEGTLRIDTWQERTGDKALIDGHYYSDKAPLPALIITPIWWFTNTVGLTSPAAPGQISPALLRLGGFVCGSLPLALIITIFWMHLRQGSSSWIPPALLATLPLFGSFLFVFSGSSFGHLLGALLLLLAWISRDRPSLMGLLAGTAVLCEYPLAVFPAWWVLDHLFKQRRRHALSMIAGGLPVLLAMGLYNTALTGNAFSMGYDYEANYAFMSARYGFGWPSLESLWGLSFSPYRGLFFYMPVLLLALLVLVRSERRSTLLTDPILLPAALSFATITCYGMWWGGWTFGPRHLTAVAVLLMWRSLPALAVHERVKAPFIVFTGFGLLCAFAAKSTAWYSMPTDERNPLWTVVWARLRQGVFTEMQIPVKLGLSPAIAGIVFILTFAGVMWMLVRLEVRAHPRPA